MINSVEQNYRMEEEPQQVLSMHPQKFAMWLFIVTVIMFFAAFTSAYIVRKAEGNWLEFELPLILWINSIVIILSSATMQWAYFSASKNNFTNLKIAISITVLLGFGFVAGQFSAWDELVQNSVFFVGNPAGSFLYVITGMHALHLVSGIVFLFIVLNSSFRYKVHSKNLARIEMCTTYWHFLGFLWLYLFGFLLLNH